ncbi:MAG TPA: hypothetical protein VN620_13515 [Candidatus Methylomirabilis sp.]|nr:hypothetical protein [Candidatus Methylomirabilis sp.]
MGFLNALFGCNHKKLSFPITVRGARRRTPAASLTGTYVVCLDCGQEFPYDWNEMKVVRDVASVRARVATVPRRAA